jgi:hypothetical protein
MLGIFKSNYDGVVTAMPRHSDFNNLDCQNCRRKRGAGVIGAPNVRRRSKTDCFSRGSHHRWAWRNYNDLSSLETSSFHSRLFKPLFSGVTLSPASMRLITFTAVAESSIPQSLYSSKAS